MDLKKHLRNFHVTLDGLLGLIRWDIPPWPRVILIALPCLWDPFDDNFDVDLVVIKEMRYADFLLTRR